MIQPEPTPFFEELTALDSFFLYAERPEAPLHVGAVYVFEGQPEAPGGRGAQGIAETLRERLHLVPRYRQRVRFRPLNIGHPVWVDDPAFDLDNHVRRTTVPRPGDDAALRELAARVLARRLDVNRPLWELTVVEGLSGGRVALINKVHHAMVDGISSVDIGTLLFDNEPSPAPVTPQPWEPRPQPDSIGLASSTLDGLRRLANLNPLSLNPFTLPGRLQELARRAAGEALAPPWAGAATLALSRVGPADRGAQPAGPLVVGARDPACAGQPAGLRAEVRPAVACQPRDHQRAGPAGAVLLRGRPDAGGLAVPARLPHPRAERGADLLRRQRPRGADGGPRPGPRPGPLRAPPGGGGGRVPRDGAAAAPALQPAVERAGGGEARRPRQAAAG